MDPTIFIDGTLSGINAIADTNSVSIRGMNNDVTRPAIGATNNQTLADLIAESETWEADIRKIPLDKDNINFTQEGLVHEGQVFGIDKECRTRLFKKVGAQASYFEKKHSPAFIALALHELTRRGHFGKKPTAITQREELITISRGELNVLSSRDVLTVIPEALGQDSLGMFVARIERDYERLELEVVSPTKTIDVRVGDIVAAGLHLTHAPYGNEATTAAALVYRYQCTNGLTTSECVGRRGPRTRKLAFDNLNARKHQRDQIYRLVQHNWEGLQKKLDSLKAITEKPARVDDLLTRWLQRARISVKETLPLLMDAWREDGAENTVWGAVNAITRVATHNADLTPRQRRIFAALAGLLAFADVHLCPRCWSVISAANDNHGAA